MPTAQQLLAEKERFEALLADDLRDLAFQKKSLAAAQARGAPANQLFSRQIEIENREQSIRSLEANLSQVDQQITAANNPTNSNPPNPQVPAAPAATPAPAPTNTSTGNPPNPQVPPAPAAAPRATATTADIINADDPEAQIFADTQLRNTGAGQIVASTPANTTTNFATNPQVPPANNNVPVVQPQTIGVYTGDPTQTDPGFVPYSARPQETPYQTDPGEIPGITVSDRTQTDPGFVDPAYGEFNTALIDTQANLPQEQDTGFSPYGEADEQFDPDFVSQPDPALFTDEYVQEQDNPVDGIDYDTDGGISPYGEENEFADPVPLIDPFEVDGDPGYGSAETEFEQDNPNIVTLEVPDPYEIDGANIGLTEEEIQEQDNPAATRQSDTLNRARAQAILQQQRKQANDGDWRVRLRLAPSAQYLYKSDSPGILQPLAVTDGVVFPYTPQITTAYKASYNSYNLTHSNYRGFFYQGSQVEDIQINAVFTAQDTVEANYLLAVIHFFRSVTKMFYGATDPAAGAPPPLVFLQGLGEYQFNLAPCVVSQFNYNLPPDVDYIRAGSPNINGTNLLQRRDRQDLPTNPFTSAWTRIKNVLEPQNIKKGAIPAPPAPPTLGTNRPTYVPTKIEISLILHPMQTREQVSKQFSLRQYANGDLLKGGFW